MADRLYGCDKIRSNPPFPIKEGISAGVGEGAEHQHKARLKLNADTPVELKGPVSEHAVGEVVSVLFARAPLRSRKSCATARIWR